MPPALARWLAAKGHETEHVGAHGMQAASDAAIWDHALATSAVIITKDEDFARRKVLTAAGPAVVWIRLPNTRRRELLDGRDCLATDSSSARTRRNADRSDMSEKKIGTCRIVSALLCTARSAKHRNLYRI